MGLASGLILDSQINASDHLGELIVKKKKSGHATEHPQQSTAVSYFFLHLMILCKRSVH